MRAVVAGAAPVPGGEAFYMQLLQSADVVVAADAAAEWCMALGRVPDRAVGDFDSSAEGAVARLREAGVPVEAHRVAKDRSDLDLAVAAARRLGATSLTITAAASARLDHTLAALGALRGITDLAGQLAEPDVAAWCVEGGSRPLLRLSGPRGALVSVFAVAGPARGVTLTGLAFPLSDATLEPLSSVGLSNASLGAEMTVSVGEGTLLVVTWGTPGARAVCAPSRSGS